jgi:hypothetical protein
MTKSRMMADRCEYPTWDGYVTCELLDTHLGLHQNDEVSTGRERWPWRGAHTTTGWRDVKPSSTYDESVSGPGG